MITFRYHVITCIIILIFFSLGLFIGSTLDAQWVDRGYRMIIENLEKRMLELSNEKNALSAQLAELNEVHQRHKKAWNSFFRESIGKNLISKEGILLSASPLEMNWIKDLEEIGVRIKTAYAVSDVKANLGDFLILYKPSPSQLEELVQQTFAPLPMVMISDQLMPPEKWDHVYVLPSEPKDEEEFISFLKGLHVLLLKSSQ